MRRAIALSIALLQPAAGAAQPAAPWTSQIAIQRDDGLLEGRFEPSPDLFRIEDSESWITPADMPPALRARAVDITSFVAVDVSAAGQPERCRILRPSANRRLDALACARLLARGRYGVRRPTPGQAVAWRWGMRVRWETLDRAGLARRQAEERRRGTVYSLNRSWPDPGPVPDDRAWPRIYWHGQLRPLALPAIQPAYPAPPGAPAEGIVGLDLLIDPALGITGCEVGVSSGNPLLDERACAVARGLRLAYAHPCDSWCEPERLPLQVVWAQRGSHIRFPLLSEHNPGPEMPRDPADTRTVRHFNPFSGVQPPAGPPQPRPGDLGYREARPVYAFEIDAGMHLVGCRTVRSTGNEALDRWLCHTLTSRMSFLPGTDAFGNAVARSGTVTLDLARDGP
jgi:hypothetical protein